MKKLYCFSCKDNMIIYDWKVTAMYTLPQVDDFTDVVVVAKWTLTGKEGEYLSSVSDGTQFSLPQGSDFIPYNELKEFQVIGWIQNTIGSKAVTDYEAQIANDIYFQAHPPVTATEQALPWK